MTPITKPKILLVDDIDNNRLAINAVLNNLYVDIVEADSGKKALELALKENFALILLDIQMPDINGFEVAEYLRSINQTKNTPIIFITAINKDEAFVFKGYELGAVDYLTKPINSNILISKIKVFLELEKNRLEQLVIKESLEQANKIALEKTHEFKSFASRVAHDLKGPLSTIASFMQLLRNSDYDNEEEKEFMMSRIESNTKLAYDIINAIYSLAELNNTEDLEKEILYLNGPIAELTKDLSADHIMIKIDCSEAIYLSKLHLPILVRNLVTNAIKFNESDQVNIRIHSTKEGDYRVLNIEDNGPGIPKDKREIVFLAMERLHDSSVSGLGLGLSMVKRVMELHEGKVEIEDSERFGGTHFKLYFPNKI